MGGLDADFIGWEQSYNCGHDEGVVQSIDYHHIKCSFIFMHII
jgi:hypothetical protein